MVEYTALFFELLIKTSDGVSVITSLVVGNIFDKLTRGGFEFVTRQLSFEPGRHHAPLQRHGAEGEAAAAVTAAAMLSLRE